MTVVAYVHVVVSEPEDVDLAYRIVQRIAAEEGVDVRTVEPPLNEVINADALAELFTADTGIVTFVYHGYTVTVTHAGAVSIESR
jgi:hypothetical protein